MRRVRYHSHGGPEVLVVEEAAIPQPGPGQVQSGLCHADIHAAYRQPVKPNPPFVPGATPSRVSARHPPLPPRIC